MRGIRRRKFITLLGGAAVWPLAVRAQQPTMPVVGLLSGGTEKEDAFRIDAFRHGLAQTGFVESHNITFMYRGAAGRYDQLPALAAELVGSRVAVIASLGPTLSAQPARAPPPAVR